MDLQNRFSLLAAALEDALGMFERVAAIGPKLTQTEARQLIRAEVLKTFDTALVDPSLFGSRADELAPCPRCGGIAYISSDSMYTGTRVSFYRGACSGCGLALPYEPTKSDAVKEWNTRNREGELAHLLLLFYALVILDDECWHPIDERARDLASAVLLYGLPDDEIEDLASMESGNTLGLTVNELYHLVRKMLLL